MRISIYVQCSFAALVPRKKDDITNITHYYIINKRPSGVCTLLDMQSFYTMLSFIIY